ncbi:NUDIX hydrolase [Nocardioides terrigena]|uniref:NUDIX hydrolase n=1 Tax=Nocardioides terrigena TaxID=424797 RepID=UPI000D2FA009|nr:NUDIX domain-containing protein [Nocardioides terrigena]
MTGTFVVAAVAFVRDGHVLTVRKRGTSRFMLPGGKLEPGESAYDAAVREIREEVGLVVDDLTLLGEFTADAANEPGHLVESTVYVASLPLTASGARVEPTAAGEIAECSAGPRWPGSTTTWRRCSPTTSCRGCSRAEAGPAELRPGRPSWGP